MKKYLVLFAILGATSLTGCAHSLVERNLDEKLAQETTVKNRSDLQVESDQLIKTAPGLSGEQRKKLSSLRDSSRTQSEQLREESFKLRAVLVKDLLSSNYSKDEVELVKSKIKDVEHERLHLFFRTVHSANRILGRWGSQYEREDMEFYDQMMLEMMYRDYR